MNKENIRNGENFFLGFFIYGVIIFISKWFMNIFNNIVIAFAPAKKLAELKSDPSFLFNVTYPFMAFFIILFYLAVIFAFFYFASYKFSFKHDSVQSKKNIYLQMIVLFAVFSIISIYNSVVEGSYSLAYWYSGAFWGNLFGFVDELEAVNKISTYDFSSISYYIEAITPQIGVFVILSELIVSILSFVLAFFARELGAKKGIDKRKLLREELYKNSPNFNTK